MFVLPRRLVHSTPTRRPPRSRREVPALDVPALDVAALDGQAGEGRLDRARARARRRVGWLGSLALAGAVTLCAACSSSKKQPSIYVHENADLYAFERVAVLPLDNLTSDRFAGEKVREVLTLELAALGAFELVDTGEVNRVLRAQSINDVRTMGPEAIANLGEALGVQGLLFGAVMEYREQRSGNLTSPDVAIAMRLLDVETGLVVWSIGDAERGMGATTRLFGVGGESQTEAVRELVRDLMLDLYQGT